tara:strand:+ start:1 stop:1101 length:1101 start_codon:yes stop_codon:yes gene_type:complete
MKSKKIVLFILIFSSLSFSWGLGIGVYKWFPYFYLLEFKQIFNSSVKREISENIPIDNSFIEKHTKSIEEKFVILKREELIEKVIFNENFLNIVRKKIDNKSEKLITEIYGNKINSVLTFSPKPKKCLKIYIQGHGGNPFFYPYHNKLLKYFLNEGCDFLSMSMIGLGLNDGSFLYPSRYGKMMLNKFQAQKHKNYAFFYDFQNPKLDPLTLFITPHYKIIKSLSSEYNDISIMGISGGGWYTVWLSALIPEIKYSISYAGSLPLEYGKFSGMSGDWEQKDSQIYNDISYWELYKLMTLDEKGKTSRYATLVYNDQDDCCYFNPYANHFKSIIDELNWNNLKVIIDENDKHNMNVELVKKIYQSIE